MERSIKREFLWIRGGGKVFVLLAIYGTVWYNLRINTLLSVYCLISTESTFSCTTKDLKTVKTELVLNIGEFRCGIRGMADKASKPEAPAVMVSEILWLETHPSVVHYYLPWQCQAFV